MRISRSKNILIASILLASGLQTANAANADVKITEWMYTSIASGAPEFMEFTNIGASSIDLTGWSFDDNTRTAGSFDLTSLGSLAAGESFIITDKAAGTFRTEWNLAATVKVLGLNTVNALGRSDEINIYDNTSSLIDQLTYNDEALLGPRARSFSGRAANAAALGAKNANLWVLSSVGDIENSYASINNDIGSLGFTSFTVAAVPEPETYAMLVAGLGLLGFNARKSNKNKD